VPDTLADWRDITIIVCGFFFIILLILLITFTFVLGTAGRSLLSNIQNVLRTEVSPLLSSARQAVQNVRGTTTFVSESTVRPIIRTYGLIARFRRALAVLLGLVKRTGRREA
jgi:hypothetical protein